MRSRFWYVGIAALLGALALAACGVNPETGSASSNAPAAQAAPTGWRRSGFAHAAANAHQRPRAPEPTSPPAPAAPALAGADSLASADFQASSDLSAWAVIDAAELINGPSVWQVQNDRLLQVGAFEGDILQYPTALVTGDAAWQNYSVSAAAYNIRQRRVWRCRTGGRGRLLCL